VVDALEAAGGARKGADLTSLNLARPVVDGEQVLVLREGEQPPATTPDVGGSAPDGGAAGAGAAGALVDLNAADAATLDTLPGIGPVLAQRIVEQRASHAFTSVDELVDVPGIGPALLERLRPLVRV
jgi:competence protein ComEA